MNIDTIESDDLDHTAEIDRLRETLATALADATKALWTAAQTAEQLASDQVYDIEHAESTTAADLRYLIADATRSVRTVQILQRHIEQP